MSIAGIKPKNKDQKNSHIKALLKAKKGLNQLLLCVNICCSKKKRNSNQRHCDTNPSRNRFWKKLKRKKEFKRVLTKI